MPDWGAVGTDTAEGAASGAMFGGPWGAAIGGGVGFLKGLLTGKPKATELDKSLAQANQRANISFGQRERALSPALGFNEKLLSGDPATAAGAIAPEANTILSQYDTARKAVQQNAPRGGGATRQMANIPFAASGKIANLFNAARRGSADALSQLFSTLSGESLGYKREEISGRLGQEQNAIDKQKQQFLQGSALGKGFGSIFSKMLTGGGGGGTPGSIDENAILDMTPSDMGSVTQDVSGGQDFGEMTSVGG